MRFLFAAFALLAGGVVLMFADLFKDNGALTLSSAGVALAALVISLGAMHIAKPACERHVIAPVFVMAAGTSVAACFTTGASAWSSNGFDPAPLWLGVPLLAIGLFLLRRPTQIETLRFGMSA